MLIALALFKICKFLVEGLRLRTACDLDLVTLNVTRPKEFAVPELTNLETELPLLIQSVANQKQFGEHRVTKISWTRKKK